MECVNKNGLENQCIVEKGITNWQQDLKNHKMSRVDSDRFDPIYNNNKIEFSLKIINSNQYKIRILPIQFLLLIWVH